MINSFVLGAFDEREINDPAQLSPLALAYMGDCVYDLYVRTFLLNTSTATAHKLHIMSAGTVCAAAQARSAKAVLPVLTEKEMGIFKRGRNAHMGTVAKNANIADYRAATGLEAVIGYVYLCGGGDRLNELMNIALDPEITQYKEKKDDSTQK